MTRIVAGTVGGRTIQVPPRGTRPTSERVREAIFSRLEHYGVVGGGTRNRLLMQYTANAIGRRVWSGPTEATAIGNLLGQLQTRGAIASVAEGRQVVRDSFPIDVYEPRANAAWDEAFGRFLTVRAS